MDIRRALVSAVLVLAPTGMGTLLLLGGGQVSSCLGPLGGCPDLPPPPAPPFLGSTAFIVAVLVIVALGWLMVAGFAIRSLWSGDRGRLRQAGVLVVAGAVAISAVGATLDLTHGARLRTVAEDAGLFALGAFIALVPVLLAWAVLTARQPARDPASPPTVPPTARS